MTVAGQPLGDGSTTEEKLRTLLAIGGELDDLDFKEHLDLSQHKDKIELVKDFAAMQTIATGGYIVVGADDHGVVSTRFGALDVVDFDPSNLHRIAHSYLPTIHVRASTHLIDGAAVAVIYVGPPEPPGVPIIVKDGQYPDGKRTTTVFTPGDVFVRRGMQSVRWLPSDLPGVLKRWEGSIREDERRRATAYADQLLQGERARAIAQGPLGSLTWRLAIEEFDAAFLEAIRSGDAMTLRRLLLTFATDASALAAGHGPEGPGDASSSGELDLLLDRLLAALALTVTYAEREWFDQLLGILVDVYRSALDPMGNARQLGGPQSTASQKLMLRVAVGVEAVGGLAVRMKQLWAIRPLAMPDQQLVKQLREPSWIRHAVTAASWARLLYLAPHEEGGQPRQIGGPVVALARQLVERIPALRPDTQVSPFELNTSPAANDKVLDSLTQFDVFWCVMAVAHSDREHNQYPSFASFYSHRAEPAFEVLIDDPEVRQLILGGDAGTLGDPEAEAKLKDTLRTVAVIARQVASSEGRWGWWPESEKLTAYLGPP
jgi:hypothetical protein